MQLLVLLLISFLLGFLIGSLREKKELTKPWPGWVYSKEKGTTYLISPEPEQERAELIEPNALREAIESNDQDLLEKIANIT